jgi:DNA-binding Lrp family transcriptional regulator
MTDDLEIAVPYMKSIAMTLRCSVRTCHNKRKELVDAGVIFYMNIGRPPRRTIFHFPSRLKAYTGLKAAKGEIV